MSPRLTLAFCGLLTLAPAAGADDGLAGEARSILSDKCFHCHGPDQGARKANLRLDRRDDAVRVLDAELLRRVTHADPAEVMPPPRSKLSLSAAEIDTLRRWVAAGAPYSKHWSFRPIADVEPPAVKNTDWVRNPIDRFILARLEAEGIAPSPAAMRETLIRRVSFDLTGLPPTLEELDSAAPLAELIDRYLKKPAYGERMAADWLDVARYSDTFGYQVDRDRFVWPWRDWVVSAFNRNLPYDRFITEQIAGDLLPDPTQDQILATTFNRLHPQKVEGGSVPEEFRVEYVADRTHTFATAFLGLTMECARCHDHKFDPISQKEYYQLFAYFNNIDEAGLYSFFTNSVPTPTLDLTDESTRERIAGIERRIAEEERKLADLRGSRRPAFAEWEPPAEPEIPGQVLHLDFEKDDIGGNSRVPGKVGQAVKLTGDDAVNTKVGNFRRFEPFTVSLWLNKPNVVERAVVFHRSRAWTDAGSRGYELLLEDGHLSWSLIHFWPGNAISVRTRDRIHVGEWVHIAVSYDGSSRADGLRIFVNGEPAELDVVRDKLTRKITGGGGDTIAIGERFRDNGFAGGLVDEFRVFSRELTAAEVGHLFDGRPIDGFEYYLAAFDAECRDRLEAVRKAREERSKAVDGLTEIMVMRELPEPRASFLLQRGAYDAHGEPVSAGTPSVFPPPPDGQPANRLGLSRWLTDPEHPLTARVAVNRLWQMCFGQGLVGTPEDFGSQGSPPTHPELLDWLAKDFVDHGWDVRRTLKLILTSATYRQSSRVTSELMAKDPENRLLGRSPSYRLPAEMLRDNALSVSGLLVDKVGGPPVRPYEVEVSFKPVKRDTGEGLYRRSLYTYWKRTGPAPAMMALDASKRDVCRVKRERTASPIQSFVLLNGPQFVEAGRVLGERLAKKHGDNVEGMIDEMFRLLTSRRPSDAERDVLLSLYREQLADFEKHPERAAEYRKAGDANSDAEVADAKAAAAGVLANTLMNFDECVMKR